VNKFLRTENKLIEIFGENNLMKADKNYNFDQKYFFDEKICKIHCIEMFKKN
jgi:hypothetical protein